MDEDIPILNNHVPLEYVMENGRLTGIRFEKINRIKDNNGRLQSVATGEPAVFYECDHVILAIGQENAFPWIEPDIGLDLNQWNMPVVDEITLQSTHSRVFFGGDAAFGPKNIIWAVAHGHEAAISIDLYCQGKHPRRDRPSRSVNLLSQKMGIHEWSYDNDHSPDKRYLVPHADKFQALKNIKVEVELGFDQRLGFKEAQRCLNCDMQTVFTAKLCIECDACVDICPVDCITFTENGDEGELRKRLKAPANNRDQAIYVSDTLATGRVMVKDEDVCVHCGLCAERCPTNAWDMKKSLIHIPHADDNAYVDTHHLSQVSA
jgi:ferredoxin